MPMTGEDELDGTWRDSRPTPMLHYLPSYRHCNQCMHLSKDKKETNPPQKETLYEDVCSFITHLGCRGPGPGALVKGGEWGGDDRTHHHPITHSCSALLQQG